MKRQRTLILGLGVTGESCVRHLATCDDLTVLDSRVAPPRAEEMQAAYPAVSFHFGATHIELNAFDRIVVSPGIADDHCVLRQAQQLAVPLLNDIDLFCMAANAPIYAITGTNGKSTVTTLVGQMLAAQGANVGVGGNLGTPALDLLADERQAYALELSSFQLQRLSAHPFAAATILNLSEDHLDRHGSMQAYAQAKHKIYVAAAVCVSNRDDLPTQPQVDPVVDATRISFGSDAPEAGHYGLTNTANGQQLMFGDQDLLRMSELLLPGQHNALNVLAALALTDSSQVPRDVRCAVAAAFPGLPHRGEVVGEVGGIRFVNDSKATNVGATIAALQGLAGSPLANDVANDVTKGIPNLVVLLGGQSKGVDMSPLRDVVAQCCSHAVVFGDCAVQLEQLLSPNLPVVLVSSLDEALTQAYALAQPGQTVLLSPACASFDMFRSFADRGEQFTALVQTLLASVDANFDGGMGVQHDA